MRIRFPAKMQMPPPEVAERCGWLIRKVDDETWEICVAEHLSSNAPGLVEFVHLADASEAVQDHRYSRLSELGYQDQVTSPSLIERAQQEVDRLLALDTREAAWSAFSLRILSTPDAQLALETQAIYSAVAGQLRDSSIWMLKFSPKVLSRQSIARVLFAGSQTPEVLDDPAAFEGVRAAKGLEATQAGAFGSYVAPAFAVASPWLLGFGFGRVLGQVVVVFGRPQSGRADGPSSDLIQLLAPKLLAEPTLGARDQPDSDPEEIRRWVRWWLHRLDRLLHVVYDPSVFVSEDGMYDYTRHFAFQLSLDRLFACITGILVHSRRDEFTRRLLMFQALDLLHGMGFGNYETLLNPDSAKKTLAALETTVPYEVVKLALPKCREAVEALSAVARGFYRTERIENGKVLLDRDDERTEAVSLAVATAQYLNLVRAGQHSFEDKVRSPRDLSLLASHTGELDPQLSDIAFLHVLNLMTRDDLVRQTILRRGLRRARQGR